MEKGSEEKNAQLAYQPTTQRNNKFIICVIYDKHN